MAEQHEPPAMRWWGWGDPARPPALTPGTPWRCLADTVGGRRSRAATARRTRARAPQARRRSASRRWRGCEASSAPTASATGMQNGSSTPPARAIRISCACAPGSRRERPTRWSSPPRHEQVRAVLELCARASVGGRAVRRRHERGGWRGAAAGRARAVRRAGHAAHGEGARPRPRVADGQRPGRRARAGARALPGARAGSRSATSRSRSSTCRSAAARRPGRPDRPRPAMARSRRWCSACASPRPAGDIALPADPASAAGPGLRQLLVGSEGTLGVISELALRVRPAPARARPIEGVMFEDFAAGVKALRALAQENALPDVARLSDGQETRMSLALAGCGRAEAPARSRVPRPAGSQRAADAWRSSASRAQSPRRFSRDAGARSRWCAATAACRWGARPGGRGSRAASRLPTCATSCSRTA